MGPIAMRGWLTAILLVASASASLAQDAFDRHTAFFVRQGAKRNAAIASLSSGEAAKLDRLQPKMENACVVVQTNGGNWTKALVGWGLRRGADGKPIPVLILERFVTYDGQRDGIAIASGKDVMLFPGFIYNLDIGQVVPSGHAADIEFTAERLLKPIAKAVLHPLHGPTAPKADDDKPDPNDHEGVLPRDFVGSWRVHVDGRFTGRLVLSVDDEGNITGKLTSDDTKSDYPVTGKISRVPHRANFEAELVNSNQRFDAYLWTKDKAALAGVVSVNDLRLGFYALREKEAGK